MQIGIDDRHEWLETDGLGGYAMGTPSGRRTRRYHSLLTVATKPPGGRVTLLNGLEVFIDTSRGSFALSSQRYAPDVVHPDGADRIRGFTTYPWPTWTYALPDGTRVVMEVSLRRGLPLAIVTFDLGVKLRRDVKLRVRPLLSGRGHHAIVRENPRFGFAPEAGPESLVWRTYPGLPELHVLTNGEYEHAPDWFRGFLYREEEARGLDCTEDLASPGVLHFDLGEGPAVMLFGAGNVFEPGQGAVETSRKYRAAERRRRLRIPDSLHRAASHYLVTRGDGRSVIAGYPWFTDWGRDTFIALRGLCLATGQTERARQVVMAWRDHIAGGMVPNRFPEEGDTPEFNTADASLWFVLAASELLHATSGRRGRPSRSERDALRKTIADILDAHLTGVRFGVRVDVDGLLLAGDSGTNLTWMDARVAGRPVTPRSGKPVEVQALWLNALSCGGDYYARHLRQARSRFVERFWNAEGGYLYDVVDMDGDRGRVDATFRPNQIFAAGGLPLRVLDADRARRVVDVVGQRLLTPLGLRTLDPADPAYRGHYRGGVEERDLSYHQGTAWPWLLGPFVEAWLRSREGEAGAKALARKRFLDPLLAHLTAAGIGHVSEIADGDHPHNPAGCPFQAWSLGELIRMNGLLA